MARISLLAIFVFVPLALVVSVFSEPKAPLAEFHGTLKSITKKKIFVTTAGEQVLIFHRGKRTRFIENGKEIGAEEVPPKSTVTVDAVPTVWGDPEAIDVIVGK